MTPDVLASLLVGGLAIAVAVAWYAYASARERRAERRLHARLRAGGARVEAAVTKVGFDMRDCYEYLELRFVSPSGAVVEGECRWHPNAPLPEVGSVVPVLFLSGGGRGDEWELEANVAHSAGV